MKTEMTLKELAEALGVDKRVRVICEDERILVLTFSKNQTRDENYSFDAGI